MVVSNKRENALVNIFKLEKSSSNRFVKKFPLKGLLRSNDRQLVKTQEGQRKYVTKYEGKQDRH